MVEKQAKTSLSLEPTSMINVTMINVTTLILKLSISHF